MAKTVLRLNAGNDNNGNPRRVILFFDEHGVEQYAVDEGYGNLTDICKPIEPVTYLGTFDTTVKQYKELLKRYEGRAMPIGCGL